MARSANTGISCFIDPAGQIYEPQPWDTATAIKMAIPRNEVITFFVSQGDIISLIAMVATLLVLIIQLIYFMRNMVRRG